MIRWPSGTAQTIEPPRSDQLHHGQGAAHERRARDGAARRAERSRRSRGRFALDNRYLPPILITLHPARRRTSRSASSRATTRPLLAIAAAIVLELVLGRLTTGKWPHLASAYITGHQRRHPDPLAGLLAVSRSCSLISITSKYVLRVNGRHLWNPSNFGVSAMLFLAPATVAQPEHPVGQHPLADAGDLDARLGDRLARRPASTSARRYVRRSSFFSFVRSADHRHPWLASVAPITGPMYQLFIFFMITDPKTTVRIEVGPVRRRFPRRRWWRCSCG